MRRLPPAPKTGITYDKLEVAFDGVAVVVSPANEAVACLTIGQLGHLGHL